MTTGFPALDADTLTALKQAIDQGFLAFSQRHGAAIEAAFAPLQDLLIGAEQALLATPWPLLLAALAALAWGASRRWPLALGSAATLAVLGLFGLWDDTLKTLAMVLVATALAVAIGAPLGVAMARWRWLQRMLTPLLDLMQTRVELYDRIGYHAFEGKLDALFAAKKK